MDNTNKGNLIFKNTLFLYGRMLITMWLNLYITRLVLANLGIENMGVYNVVGSVVGMFSVFTGGMTAAVQRFMTFELGKPDGNPNRVFCSSLNVIFILVAVTLVLLEVGGVWMLNNKLNLPEESRGAVFWVFQLSVLTCAINMISIPYNALIVAHEKMDAFAVFAVINVILHFIAIYAQKWIDASSRLLAYSVFLTIVSVAMRVAYQIYCRVKFAESEFHFVIDGGMIRQIGKFTTIATIDTVFVTLNGQGIVLIANHLFGVTLNAVMSIAGQVLVSLQSFTNNMVKAVQPQITKTYASGDMVNHKRLVYSGTKMATYLLYFLMIPLLFCTEPVLRLWLGTVPNHAVLFVQGYLVSAFLLCMFEPFRTAVWATNNITKFMLLPDGVALFVGIPCIYIATKHFGLPSVLLAAMLVSGVITFAYRWHLGCKVTVMRRRELAVQVLLPCLLVFVVSSAVCFGLVRLLGTSLAALIAILLLNSAALSAIIYAAGLNVDEKRLLKGLVKKMISRIQQI